MTAAPSRIWLIWDREEGLIQTCLEEPETAQVPDDCTVTSFDASWIHELTAKNKRDEFAIAALTGLITGKPPIASQHLPEFAEKCYAIADAMIAARIVPGGDSERRNEQSDAESGRLDNLDYSIALQRFCEHLIRRKPVPDDVLEACPHHADMLKKSTYRPVFAGGTGPQAESPEKPNYMVANEILQKDDEKTGQPDKKPTGIDATPQQLWITFNRNGIALDVFHGQREAENACKGTANYLQKFVPEHS